MQKRREDGSNAKRSKIIWLCECHSYSVFLRNYKLLEVRQFACSRLLGFMLNKWFLMRKFVVSSDDNLPCSLLVSLSNSACRALWVLMKSFLSRQWESLRSEEGHSAEKVKAHGICWVMSPSLAHRKTESLFLLSNLKFIKTSGKQTQEKLFQKHYTFRLPIPLKMKSVAMGVGGKEPPRIYRRLDQNVPRRQKALLSSLLNPLCWRGRAEDFGQ